MQATATAHPNVALAKYWGKRPGTQNLPATPSLSITLDGLTTRTRVTVDPGLAADRIVLDGRPVHDPKIEACLTRLRGRASHSVPHLVVETGNDFPTAAGLASSASGFAALVTAVDAALGLHLDATVMADEARRASASAARSLLGGFVTLAGNDEPASWVPRQLLAESDWPLEVVVAICADVPKAVSSSEGMALSRATSPYYDRWLATAQADFAAMTERVLRHDFSGLADLAEANCLAMHSTMLAARPGLVYWNGATVECIHCIRALRSRGVGVFFTIDAGPQVKAICLPGARADVEAALAGVGGVDRLIRSGLGGGARLEAHA